MAFEKRNVIIAGRAVPGLVISQPSTEIVELPSGKRIPSTFADVMTLRETNPDGPNAGQQYLTVTRENLRFTTLRFNHVIGLDVTEDGTLIQLAELEERRTADIIARQNANLAAKTPVSASLESLLGTEPEAAAS